MLCFLLSFASAEPLSLAQTLELVQSQNPEIQLARLGEDKANLERLKSLTQLAPSIELTSSWLDFGEPLEVNLLGDGAQDVDCSAFDAFGMGDLCSSFSEPLRLRDGRIYDGSIQAVLPLSALYSIYQGYQANTSIYQSKKLENTQLSYQIQQQVIDLYLQALHLETVRAFTQDTQRRLEHNQRTILAFVAQDLLHPVESLRIQKALAEVELAELRATQGRVLLLQQLELLLGQPIEPIPLKTKPVITEAIDLATSPDLQISQLQRDAAKAGYKASVGQLFPSVALLAARTTTEGQGALTPTEQQYLGVAIQGDFRWGQKLLTTRQARLDLEMAEQGLELQQRALTLQQQALQNEWIVAKEQETIAKQQVDISEEQLRQQQEKFDQQLITVSELIDAENELLKSRLDLSKAENNTIIRLSQYQYTFSKPLQFE